MRKEKVTPSGMPPRRKPMKSGMEEQEQKVYRLAREMHTQRYTALGVALAWLVWLDEQTEDGQTGLSAEEVDDMLGFRGAAAALVRIGWASIGGDGTLVAEEFGKHCGASAKERAETARRVARCRARKGEARSERYFCNGDRNGDDVTDVTDEALSDALPEENRREYMTLSARARACEPAPLPDEVMPVMAALNLAPLQGEAISECVTRFIDEMEASGWCDRRGVPLHDWRAAARNWARRYAERLSMTSRNDSKNSRQRKDCNNADDYR